uniref:Uncharacterized protein n=1 Tax=Anguilla anguilla TaxID=7936 RepID=A0A0E9T0F1_ANGAN
MHFPRKERWIRLNFTIIFSTQRKHSQRLIILAICDETLI